MKVRSALRKLCSSCRIIKRGKKLVVSCKANPKHKQRQGFATLAAAALLPARALPSELELAASVPAELGLARSLLAAAPAADDDGT